MGRGPGRAGTRRATRRAAPAPATDRRAMEKTMVDVFRLLAEQDFANIDEANQFLADLMAKGGGIPAGQAATPLEEAQDIMYEAWEATGARRAQLARKALEISPDCADAYVLLAEEKARTVEEARDFFAQGIAAGDALWALRCSRKMPGISGASSRPVHTCVRGRVSPRGLGNWASGRTRSGTIKRCCG